LGYHWVAGLSPGQRKTCLTVIRKFSGASAGAWSERDQINYVIDLAVTFQRVYMPLW
jgi:hypothetical protein